MFFKEFINEITNQIKNNYTYKSLVLTFLIVLLLFLPLGIVLDKQHKKELITFKREEVKSQLKDYSMLLTRVINDKFSLLKSLEVYTKENWNQEIKENDFNQFAYGLYSSNSGIRNLIIAPEGVNKYVYPIKNNKEAVGHNLLEDKRPEVRKAVNETIDSKKPVASGPYKLRQGGDGIILRKAIYKNNNFWGLVTMALDMSPIYEYVKLKNENSSLKIALKRKEEVFFGENNIFEKNPVNLTLSYQGGKFIIAGIPNKGWNESIENNLIMFRKVLFGIIFLLAIITYILSYRSFKVQALVENKTKHLKEMNSLMQEKERIITEEKNNIEYLSLHDYITGLYNRRYFENELKRLESSRKYPITIVIIDLDGLKVINDNYGHKMGDQYIINTAEILKSTARTEDIIARIGGDEFAVLLPKTTKRAAERIEKRIKEKCKKTKNDLIPISIALGRATKEKSEKDIEEVLKNADDKMYKNKLSESRSSKSNIVQGLINALNSKSNETKEHSLRMTKMAFEFGQKLNLSNSEQNRLSVLATLHDIGKINIKENILKKKGSLNDEEWKSIKKHSEYGYKIAKSSEEFAEVAEDILAHHENWDGKGYPHGLKGENIPYLARIISIIDAYDVMTHDRPYKNAISKEEALAEIEKCAGSQFDPELAEKFIKMMSA